MGGSDEHIVMLPYMAHGHLIPFLALAKQILHTTTTTHLHHQFTITIATTSLNTTYLRSAIAADPSLSPPYRIRLVSLPFDASAYGLPPNTQNTETVPITKVATLFHASTSLEAPVLQLISNITAEEGRPPICIISDIFLGWATRVAARSQTVNVSFSTGGTYGTAAYVSVWENLPHRLTESDEFPVSGFPDSCRFHRTQLHRFIRSADGKDEWSRFFQPQIRLSLGSFGWLCNTAEEIEILGTDALRRYSKLPVWTIGPLLPPALLNSDHSSASSNLRELLGRHSGRESGISPQECLDWLDSHPEDSVLYISFGSQNTVTAPQMMELASGLEASGKPFLWVIRPPFGFNLKGEFKPEWLPNGFDERIHEKKQGLLVPGWAPQLEILCHKSTGAFLSHCGWNSTIESLSQGVPIIGWPLAAEQAYNSKMLVEEMGVSIELARGYESSVEREEVKRVIDLVMENKRGKGEEMKKKAVEIGKMIRAAMRQEGGEKGSSIKAMEDFIAALFSARDSSKLG